MERWLGQKRGRDNADNAGVQSAQGVVDSRFVECPGCGRAVPLHRIHAHLDTECTSSTSSISSGGGGAAQHRSDDNDGSGGGDKVVKDGEEKALDAIAVRLQQRKPSSAVQITKYCRETRSKISISLAQLREEVPCDIIPNYLEESAADQLLSALIDASKEWKQHTWWMFDKAYQTPRLAAMYSFTDFAKDAENMQLDIGLVDLPKLCTETLRDAAELVQNTVNCQMLLRPAPEDDPALRYRILPLPGMDPHRTKDMKWEATYALCNLYRDHNDCVGGHSDRMSSLGPLPTIAALSLGTGRRFKFNKTGQDKSTGNSYSIQLPHNSLLIMWPPCQEQWTHEVPRVQASSMQPHPTAGPIRVSITFRQFRQDYFDFTPECNCRRKCILKASSRRGEHYQRYYYACDTASESKPCGFFQWAEWCIPKELSAGSESSRTQQPSSGLSPIAEAQGFSSGELGLHVPILHSTCVQSSTDDSMRSTTKPFSSPRSSIFR